LFYTIFPLHSLPDDIFTIIFTQYFELYDPYYNNKRLINHDVNKILYLLAIFPNYLHEIRFLDLSHTYPTYHQFENFVTKFKNLNSITIPRFRSLNKETEWHHIDLSPLVNLAERMPEITWNIDEAMYRVEELCILPYWMNIYWCWCLRRKIRIPHLE